MVEKMETIFILKFFIAAALTLTFYFLPAIIADKRAHRNHKAISALNLLLGWSVLGWIISLVWSLTDNTTKA